MANYIQDVIGIARDFKRDAPEAFVHAMKVDLPRELGWTLASPFAFAFGPIPGCVVTAVVLARNVDQVKQACDNLLQQAVLLPAYIKEWQRYEDQKRETRDLEEAQQKELQALDNQYADLMRDATPERRQEFAVHHSQAKSDLQVKQQGQMIALENKHREEILAFENETLQRIHGMEGQLQHNIPQVEHAPKQEEQQYENDLESGRVLDLPSPPPPPPPPPPPKQTQGQGLSQ
jgi:hypothetical protein